MLDASLGADAQEGYWRMDTHQTELYKCRLSVCLGEAEALQTLHQGVSYLSDEFNRTMSAAERANPIQLDTCRDGHTGRLCQVRLSPSHVPLDITSSACSLAHALPPCSSPLVTKLRMLCALVRSTAAELHMHAL
jgi:hypothetical protein